MANDPELDGTHRPKDKDKKVGSGQCRFAIGIGAGRWWASDKRCKRGQQRSGKGCLHAVKRSD